MAEALVHVSNVFLVAAQSVDRFRENRIEQACLRSREHLLQARAHHIRVAQGFDLGARRLVGLGKRQRENDPS